MKTYTPKDRSTFKTLKDDALFMVGLGVVIYAALALTIGLKVGGWLSDLFVIRE